MWFFVIATWPPVQIAEVESWHIWDIYCYRNCRSNITYVQLRSPLNSNYESNLMYSDGPSHCSYKLALRVSLWQPMGFCNTTLSNFLVRQQITVHIPYYMEQSPSGAANRFSPSQEISRILGNQKVHYHIHKCPHFQFLKTHLNIILPSIPGSSKWLFPSDFSTKIP